MGKVSPKDRGSKTPKQKRRLRSSSNKYLRPGALAQLRYNKASAAKSCTDLGKKRVAVLDAIKIANDDVSLQTKDFEKTPLMLSPVDLRKQNNLVRTPKTPQPDDSDSESRLESLPMDLLVKILCHLHHDQLRAVFHVSERIRKAVLLARQFHFNYTTPDRSRQEMLSTMTPLPTEHWPFIRKRGGKNICIRSPHTPKAPKQGPRPPRTKLAEMRQITAVLFPESAFPSRCMVPSVLASSRVLFYEDELCQAVAQNKLL
ncbi:F-box protein At4g35930 [Malania oleifera]|uniref:F-box protein At4g35930 n=1 Tax=Malania oleifera TaxID=397392 RepID=UPI0025AE7585|nr:F-box protein At4g35930 [Malania oleifera]